MKTMNYAKICMLCVFALLLTACGKDDDSTSNMNAKLCRTWVEEYTEDDVTYTHQLIFTQNGNSGQELKKKYDHTSSTANTETRDFTWKWEDGTMECLVLSYGAGDVKYLENVWIREHYLSGKLDGVLIMMTDANYVK
ncbi:uncharacterized protein BN744_00519 [Bacteroides sp. CAG:633]|uniref:hypothetical protein n=1 Tax=Bacteroides sp. CAG:633 TaxID=1262744 RepID=UPI000335DFC5|nr:hypothetical protein [Bacteroides sp. CAG:633]CDB12162.1 uncharacterized protein BN744_00519 [Bacteroides sp. CAG:633]